MAPCATLASNPDKLASLEALLADANNTVQQLHKEHKIVDAALSERLILHAHDQDRDGMRAVVPTVEEGEVRSILAKSHWQRGPPTATAILGSSYYPPHNAPRPDFGFDGEVKVGRPPVGAGCAHALPSSGQMLRDRLGQSGKQNQKPQSPLSNSVNRELLNDASFKSMHPTLPRGLIDGFVEDDPMAIVDRHGVHCKRSKALSNFNASGQWSSVEGPARPGSAVHMATPRSAQNLLEGDDFKPQSFVQPSIPKDPESSLELTNVDLASLTRKDRIRLLERTIQAESVHDVSGPNTSKDEVPILQRCRRARAKREQIARGETEDTTKADSAVPMAGLPGSTILQQQHRGQGIASWRGVRERRAREDDDRRTLALGEDWRSDSPTAARSPASGSIPGMRDLQPPPPPPGAQPTNSPTPRSYVPQDVQAPSPHPGPQPSDSPTHRDTFDPPLVRTLGRRARLQAERREFEERAGDELQLGDTGSRLTLLKQQVQGANEMDLVVCKGLCTALEVRAYELRPGDVLQGVTLLAEGSNRLQSSGAGLAAERVSSELRSAAHTLVASLSARTRELRADSVMQTLQTMADTGIAEQAYLDAMLARLAALLRDRIERSLFTPNCIVRILNALGRMYQEGGEITVQEYDAQTPETRRRCELNPRAGATGPSMEANKSFLELFHARLLSELPNFLDDEFGWLNEAYVVHFLDNDQKRRLLYRAAQLQIGLREENRMHLQVMQRMERAVRQHSATFMAALPIFTQDFCEKVARAN
jgi:hypothetical protein